MFPSLARLKLRNGKDSPATPLHRVHGNIYCAALNINRLTQNLSTPEDFDRLYCALANLEDLARALDSSASDLADIVQWRKQMELRAAEFRAEAEKHEPLPHPQLQIDPNVLEAQTRRREAV